MIGDPHKAAFDGILDGPVKLRLLRRTILGFPLRFVEVVACPHRPGGGARVERRLAITRSCLKIFGRPGTPARGAGAPARGPHGHTSKVLRPMTPVHPRWNLLYHLGHTPTVLGGHTTVRPYRYEGQGEGEARVLGRSP